MSSCIIIVDIGGVYVLTPTDVKSYFHWSSDKQLMRMCGWQGGLFVTLLPTIKEQQIRKSGVCWHGVVKKTKKRSL